MTISINPGQRLIQTDEGEQAIPVAIITIAREFAPGKSEVVYTGSFTAEEYDDLVRALTDTRDSVWTT